MLGEGDPTVSIGEGIRGIASRLASAPRFEGWILRPLLEEIRKGLIKVTQRVLERDGTDFGKKGFLRFLFPFGEFSGGKVIADRFLLLLPCHSAIFQSLIVNIASAAERFSQLRHLFVSGKEFVFERLLNYQGNILYPISEFCKHC